MPQKQLRMVALKPQSEKRKVIFTAGRLNGHWQKIVEGLMEIGKRL